MRTILLPLTIVAVLAAACGSGANSGSAVDSATVAAPSADLDRAPTSTDAPTATLAAGFNEAGFNLLRTLPADQNEILSPTSIGHAILMAGAAADEPTGAAIDTGFTLPEGMAAHDAWNAIDQMVDASNGATTNNGEPTPTVTIADRIWPRNGLALGQGFVDLLATHHGAEVETIDVSRPAASRARINEWVSDQTNELIPELLPENFIDDGTLVVLTNAVYFKADWQLPFVKYGTIEGEFRNVDGTVSSAEFMLELEQSAPRGIGDGWAAAELPYMGGDYSMLVIVPDDFETFRSGLSQATLHNIDGQLDSGPYELQLPKWETESAIDLMPWLTGMGAAPGTFPDMGGGFIGGAVHGAVITVDEIGTEAAAATALAVQESGPPQPEFTIAADRPFLYVIRHIDSGLVLFTGQVTQLS